MSVIVPGVPLPRPWLTALVVALLAQAALLTACERSRDETVSDTRQVLRRSLGAEPATLDPQLAEDNASLAVIADLYEGLTRIAADGSVDRPAHVHLPSSFWARLVKWRRADRSAFRRRTEACDRARLGCAQQAAARGSDPGRGDR